MFSDTPATFAKYVLDPCTPSIKKVDKTMKEKTGRKEKKKKCWKYWSLTLFFAFLVS